MYRSSSLVAGIAVVVLFAMTSGSSARGQGTYISAAGPVHRSMGGASTAAPLTPLGALYWNPATISEFDRSSLEVGFDFMLAQHSVSSSVGGVSGTTDAEPGVFPIPNVGWVYRTPEPSITFGLGINSVAGFKTNLPSDPTNPVLAPPPVSQGGISSEATFLQFAPVVSWQIDDRISVAAGPVATMAQLAVSPFFFDSANLDGTYASGRATRFHWGGGGQAGMYYRHDEAWRFGASVKSPAWIEEFRFFGEDETGAPRVLEADIDLPLIVSTGAAYSGFENHLIAVDLRYFDYANANGFGDPATFDSTGRVQGLDWQSVFACSGGVQRRLTERTCVRAGYSWNQNPIANDEAFFSTAAPLVYEHTISAGGTLALSDAMAVSVAYSYLVENSRTGQLVGPAGPVAGSTVSNEMEAHFLSFGVVLEH